MGNKPEVLEIWLMKQ